MPGLREIPNAPAPAQDFIAVPPHFPEVPEEIIARFDSAQQWNDDLTTWYKQLSGAVMEAAGSVTQIVNQNSATLDDIVVQQGNLTVEIQTETTARIAADELLAQRIVTVSAIAGSASHITVNSTPPGTPAVNDLWVNNSVPTQPVTYYWSGAAWVEQTEPVSVAAVAAEQTARITADGFLSGKYTLTVIAGNVVTGMNITSSTGSGSDVSSVIFRATDFQIYNGVSGITMFSVSGSNVNLAGTLTVSTSGKVFIGTGTYANTNTAWYVDSAGKFSLKDQLTWDGSTLTIAGSAVTTVDWTTQVTNRPLDNNGQIVTAAVPSGSALFLGSDHLGYYASGAWKTYMDSSGNFYLGGVSGALQWNGSTLTISGYVATSGAAADVNANATTISGGKITASSITTTQLNVSQLSAITADMGSITAGNITVDSSGFIRGGASGYNSGTGWWLGYSSGYKFFVGNSAGANMMWDGSTLSSTSLSVSTGTFDACVVTTSLGGFSGSNAFSLISGGCQIGVSASHQRAIWGYGIGISTGAVHSFEAENGTSTYAYLKYDEVRVVGTTYVAVGANSVSFNGSVVLSNSAGLLSVSTGIATTTSLSVGTTLYVGAAATFAGTVDLQSTTDTSASAIFRLGNFKIGCGRTPGAGTLQGYLNLVAEDGTTLNVPFYN